MCLNPTIILNPRYSQHRHEFKALLLNGKQVNQTPCGDNMFYPRNLSSFSSLHVGRENLRDFTAVRLDGTFEPIFMAVNCNKCLECVESKRSALRVRMYLEQMSHNCPPVFFTLTYNNENLPEDGVSKSDVRKFLNRLHLYLGRAGYPTYFRHVVFSEYGSLHGRPHYHGIFYGLDWVNDLNIQEFFEVLEKAWGNGYVRCEQVAGRAFRYVSKYVGKDVSSNKCQGRNPDFWMASRKDGGLGSAICKDPDFLELCSTPQFPTVTLRVEDRCYTVTLPAYIRDKVLPPLSSYVPRKQKLAFMRLHRNMEYFHYWCKRDMFLPEWMTSADLYGVAKACNILYRKNKSVLNTYEVLFDNLIKDGIRDVLDRNWYFRQTDFLEIYHQVVEDIRCLRELCIDLNYVMSRLHERELVQERFMALCAKLDSEKPPTNERLIMLQLKHVKDNASRCKDGL
ncbi:replication initiator protein [Dipodfec virus UOA04_Rod_495]|nr:replication initiator protein [Dipodfec virus UOA04_Rod_495]